MVGGEGVTFHNTIIFRFNINALFAHSEVVTNIAI